MIRFAYPNVKGSRFLGCGRFVALSSDSSPDAGYVPAEPNTGNRSKIMAAASLLAPESFDANNFVYERKDDPTADYFGSSLDLAYLLALVSRSRSLKWESYPHDIWCTGALDIVDGHPFLNDVYGDQFSVKLESFISESNEDKLFIAPTVNIQHPGHYPLIQANRVRVISLKELCATAFCDLFELKTVLKVHGHELDSLASAIFSSASDLVTSPQSGSRTASRALVLSSVPGKFVEQASQSVESFIGGVLDQATATGAAGHSGALPLSESFQFPDGYDQGNTREPEISFSNPDVLTLLQTMVRAENFTVSIVDGELRIDDRPFRDSSDAVSSFSETGLKSRIGLLARRLGFPNVHLDALVLAWRHEILKGDPVFTSRLVELAREAATWRGDTNEILQEWRGAMEKRLSETAPQLMCVDRFHGPPSPEDLEKVLELNPLLENWPLRLMTHRDWIYIDALFPDIEPMLLDDVWEDVRVIDLQEVGSLSLESNLVRSMDARYDEWQWMAEPAQFVLERLRGSMALIGAPGIGKTTLLKWIARNLIKEPGGRFLLPIYVPLRKYALEMDDGKGLLDFALHQCGVSHPSQVKKWESTLSYLSGTGLSTVLLLLDGWDEVPIEARERLAEEIRLLENGYAMIITSRPSAYPRSLPVDRFYEIVELSPESIHALSKRWFRNVGMAEGADMLLEHLDAYPDLRRLARNPFLLHLICGIFYRNVGRPGSSRLRSLPTSRTGLYREAIERIMVHHSMRFPSAPFDEVRRRQVERLALWLFMEAPDAPRYVFNGDDVLLSCGDRELLPTVLQPARLITQWSPEGGALHFIHATFQEYLAARSLMGREADDIIVRIREHAFDGAWQEILRFMATGREEVRRSFWVEMRRIAQTPDRYGLLFVKMAALVAEADTRDGGQSLLGIDLRDELWTRILEGTEVNFFVDAYAELDAPGYMKRVEEALPNCAGESKASLERTTKRIRTAESSAHNVNSLLYGDRDAAAHAVYNAAYVLNGEGRKALQRALSSPDTPVVVKKNVMRALGHARDYESVNTLMEIARCKEETAKDALYALSQIGGRTVSRGLVGMLSRESDLAGKAAIINALGHIRDSEARDGLMEELAMTPPDDPLVPEILDALCDNPLSRGCEVVIEFLNHQDEEVRTTAARALVEAVGSEVTEALSKAAKLDESLGVRIEALSALEKQARPSDVHWLAEKVRDISCDEDERGYALQVILNAAEQYHYRQGCAWLKSMAADLTHYALEQPDHELAFAAASRGHLLGEELGPKLAEVCADEAHSLSTKAEACLSLGKLRYQGALQILLDLVRREPDVPDDEALTQMDLDKRLARAAAEAITAIDPSSLLHEPGLTARNALCKFSANTGCLVFDDHILDGYGRVIHQ